MDHGAGGHRVAAYGAAARLHQGDAQRRPASGDRGVALHQRRDGCAGRQPGDCRSGHPCRGRRHGDLGKLHAAVELSGGGVHDRRGARHRGARIRRQLGVLDARRPVPRAGRDAPGAPARLRAAGAGREQHPRDRLQRPQQLCVVGGWVDRAGRVDAVAGEIEADRQPVRVRSEGVRPGAFRAVRPLQAGRPCRADLRDQALARGARAVARGGRSGARGADEVHRTPGQPQHARPYQPQCGDRARRPLVQRRPLRQLRRRGSAERAVAEPAPASRRRSGVDRGRGRGPELGGLLLEVGE